MEKHLPQSSLLAPLALPVEMERLKYYAIHNLFASQVVLPFPVPDVEKTFSIDDPDLPKLEKELTGDVALKLPPGYTVDQLKWVKDFYPSRKISKSLTSRWIAVWCTRAKEVLGSLQIKEIIGGNEEVKVIKDIVVEEDFDK